MKPLRRATAALILAAAVTLGPATLAHAHDTAPANTTTTDSVVIDLPILPPIVIPVPFDSAWG